MADNILLMDEVTARLLTLMADESNIANKVKFSELEQKLGNAQLRTDSKPKPLADLDQDKSYALIQSPIYTNLYYYAKDFDRYFRDDTKSVITKLAYKMGAREVRVEIEKEEKLGKTEESSSSSSLDSSVKGNNIEKEMSVNGKYTRKNDNFSSNMQESRYSARETHVSERGFGKTYTKEQLRQYINDNNIAIHGLPDFFSVCVDQFLNDGFCGGIHTAKKMLEEFSNIDGAMQKYQDFNLGMVGKVPAIRGKFSLSIKDEKSLKQSISEYKKLYIFYYVKFPQ